MRRTCDICGYRVVDTCKGDWCRLGDFPLMDSRFKYEYELLKLKSSCPVYCPLSKEKNGTDK